MSRNWYLPRLGEVILTDTVGFIRDLPEDLVAAFHTTLQELQEADVLVHVIDAHAQNPEQHISAVEHILTELGLQDIPCVRFFNKGDLIDRENMQRLCSRFDGIGGSALDETSLNVVRQEIGQLLSTLQKPSAGIREAGTFAMIENGTTSGI